MNFILKKEITASLINRGFAIPNQAKQALAENLSGGVLAHGEKCAVKIILSGEIYDATLTSVNFDRQKYPNHQDIWQIVYSANSPIAKKFAEIFARSRAANFKPVDSEREYFILCATDTKNIFSVEPIGAVGSLDEVFVENLLERPILTDADSALIEKFQLEKIRRLNREIGDYLKQEYNFCCQICGINVGKIYGVNVAECHHIDYFVRSLNNDAANLLIICPNHHRLIHAANPTFEREEKIFRYPNGVEEKLVLNCHL